MRLSSRRNETSTLRRSKEIRSSNSANDRQPNFSRVDSQQLPPVDQLLAIENVNDALNTLSSWQRGLAAPRYRFRASVTPSPSGNMLSDTRSSLSNFLLNARSAIVSGS